MTVGDPSTCRLFIFCSPVLSLMCDICHSSPIGSVKFDMIEYYRIIDHVIHPQIFILLRLLFDVMLSCSLESVYKSKLKEKSGSPQGFLVEFLK
jgi:hypothetical protein